ncbi:MAG: hypothetical protein UX21_C0029G0002 [Microgenomates group bacterium GW2011_GWC2_45_8]|nr:MAG: hypothetical protein UX21_C0029G0002 [Microgenomates group bacterium GW2011_GWC2_45_8]
MCRGLIAYRDIATSSPLISGENRSNRSSRLDIIWLGCGRRRVTNLIHIRMLRRTLYSKDNSTPHYYLAKAVAYL